MPRYITTEAAFVDNRMVPASLPGQWSAFAFDYDGVPGPHMQPAVDEKGREDKKAREAKDAAAKNERPAPGHPKYLGDLIDHNVAGGGETNGRIEGATGLTQQTPPGIRVDDTGQVRGVTDGVGDGDPGDGSRRDDTGAGPGLPDGKKD